MWYVESLENLYNAVDGDFLRRHQSCFWAARELGITMKELARRLGLTPPAVSISVRRGEELVSTYILL